MTEQEAGVRGYLDNVQGSIRIPAGSPSRLCKACPDRIYWVGNRAVSIRPYKDLLPGWAPTATEDGAGVDHHSNCPKAAQFTRKKRR